MLIIITKIFVWKFCHSKQDIQFFFVIWDRVTDTWILDIYRNKDIAIYSAPIY